MAQKSSNARCIFGMHVRQGNIQFKSVNKIFFPGGECYRVIRFFPPKNFNVRKDYKNQPLFVVFYN